MIANKAIKAYDGTIVFVDHIVSLHKTSNEATLIAKMVNGTEVTLSLSAKAQPVSTIMGNHVQIIGKWEA